MGFCRPGGRPPGSTVHSAKKSRWAPVDPRVDRPLKEKHSFLRAVDPAVDPENPRATCRQSVDPSGRPTDVHKRARPDTGAGRRAGRPVSPETEKQQQFLEILGIFVKTFLR